MLLNFLWFGLILLAFLSDLLTEVLLTHHENDA